MELFLSFLGYFYEFYSILLTSQILQTTRKGMHCTTRYITISCLLYNTLSNCNKQNTTCKLMHHEFPWKLPVRLDILYVAMGLFVRFYGVIWTLLCWMRTLLREFYDISWHSPVGLANVSTAFTFDFIFLPRPEEGRKSPRTNAGRSPVAKWRREETVSPNCLQ